MILWLIRNVPPFFRWLPRWLWCVVVVGHRWGDWRPLYPRFSMVLMNVRECSRCKAEEGP